MKSTAPQHLGNERCSWVKERSSNDRRVGRADENTVAEGFGFWVGCALSPRVVLRRSGRADRSNRRCSHLDALVQRRFSAS